ncbi:MAG: cell division protein FtsZ [Candidatus Aureabacteria bacterium]|nr:cell division protein FtsZ [Candidatus Auribacterota bacterium]
MITENTEAIRPVRIRVLGIGGAGSNALDQMLRSNIENIDYIAINTDRQALARSSVARKMRIGERITHGLGAGGNPDVGRQAAMDSLAEIEESVADCDILFIVAGFGGGTGTGVAPVVAQAAREKNILTVCIATTPFDFEGQKRKSQALEGVRRVDDHADTIITVANDKLFQIADMNLSLAEAFAFTNDILSEGVQCIARLINKTGLINLDFADVRTIMANGGRAALGFSASSGQGSAVEAARRALENPLFDLEALPRARGILISIMGGDDLGLREVKEAAEKISELGNRNAHVIFGAVVDAEFRGRRLVTVLATSLDGERAKAEEAQSAVSGAQAHEPVPQQTLIDLDFNSYEHFEDTEPTIVEGENLDVPTFLRKRVQVTTGVRDWG